MSFTKSKLRRKLLQVAAVGVGAAIVGCSETEDGGTFVGAIAVDAGSSGDGGAIDAGLTVDHADAGVDAGITVDHADAGEN